jgi:hypothetical protein
MRTEYTIMRTDFARCRTSRHMGISFAKFATKTEAWWATMAKIAQLNAVAGEDTFFWVKYK